MITSTQGGKTTVQLRPGAPPLKAPSDIKGAREFVKGVLGKEGELERLVKEDDARVEAIAKAAAVAAEAKEKAEAAEERKAVAAEAKEKAEAAARAEKERKAALRPPRGQGNDSTTEGAN